VQKLINCQLTTSLHLRRLAEDGVCGPATITAIQDFQRRAARLPFHDGIVTPAGPTWISLQSTARPSTSERKSPAAPASSELTDRNFIDAAAAIDPAISPALLHAFADVESGGRSGFGPSGKPKIAFEGHVFRKLTGHIYDKTHPLLSYPYVEKAGPQWQQNNKDQATAWKTLDSADALDHEAAIQACSWGMFQVMGFNYSACGYKDVDSFVDAMKQSARGQLNAFVGFCKKTPGMIGAMKGKDFQTMATLYNGESYGDYDKRIARAYKRHGGA
jgi:hypothetical protein